MPELSSLLTFALISLGMALTPGPNMVYLLSRSISQGRTAGLISLGGVALGFVFYMTCAALGITAIVMAVPYAYDALRIGGALYLFYLAWQALKPGGRSPFEVKHLSKDSPRKLFLMGFLTNLLNPKIAVILVRTLEYRLRPLHWRLCALARSASCHFVLRWRISSASCGRRILSELLSSPSHSRAGPP